MLSPFAYFVAPRGPDDQPEEDLAALQAGSSGGEAAMQPQACCRSRSTCSDAGTAEPALGLDFLHDQMASGTSLPFAAELDKQLPASLRRADSGTQPIASTALVRKQLPGTNPS